MRVTEITVSAGRVVSHPTEQYSNLRPGLTLKAVIDEGEDFETVCKTMQAKAEKLIEDHKNSLVEGIVALEQMRREDREIQSLESEIEDSQRRLERLRSRHPSQLAAAAGFSGNDNSPL